ESIPCDPWSLSLAVSHLVVSLLLLRRYKQLLSKARGVELARHDIILCTCITASSRTLISLPVSQLVIDECGMCTEPETLVPLVSHKFVQTVVLLGDHRQLRPVVLHDLCRTLRMDQSLFERYQEEALLLDTQYRMVRNGPSPAQSA
ncbi:hypothetical protein FKM82_028153, partial [Ascaphus truei]